MGEEFFSEASQSINQFRWGADISPTELEMLSDGIVLGPLKHRSEIINHFSSSFIEFQKKYNRQTSYVNWLKHKTLNIRSKRLMCRRFNLHYHNFSRCDESLTWHWHPLHHQRRPLTSLHQPLANHSSHIVAGRGLRHLLDGWSRILL